jgi:hypothetical protein
MLKKYNSNKNKTLFLIHNYFQTIFPQLFNLKVKKNRLFLQKRQYDTNKI